MEQCAPQFLADVIIEESLDLAPAFELRFPSMSLLLDNGLSLVGADRRAESRR